MAGSTKQMCLPCVGLACGTAFQMWPLGGKCTGYIGVRPVAKAKWCICKGVYVEHTENIMYRHTCIILLTPSQSYLKGGTGIFLTALGKKAWTITWCPTTDDNTVFNYLTWRQHLMSRISVVIIKVHQTKPLWDKAARHKIPDRCQVKTKNLFSLNKKFPQMCEQSKMWHFSFIFLSQKRKHEKSTGVTPKQEMASSIPATNSSGFVAWLALFNVAWQNINTWCLNNLRH